jgi:cytoskeleton protein RodZ
VVDELENPDQEPSNEEATGPLCGERLAEARRELQIPVLEIAKELHLDEYKVRALESNDFAVIGAPVFAKGHLRKYAQIVRVNEADIMDDYYLLTRSQESQPALSLRPRQRQAISPGPWIAVIAALILIATAYWWFAVRTPAVETPVTGQIAPSQPIETSDDAEEPVEVPADEQFPDEPVDMAEPEAAVVEPPPADTGRMTLQINYSGDCWTEITDSRGERLFFDLGKTGRTVNLSGEAPFNVLFGDAENVSLRVNGESFELPAVDRRGTVRLTITGT